MTITRKDVNLIGDSIVEGVKRFLNDPAVISNENPTHSLPVEMALRNALVEAFSHTLRYAQDNFDPLYLREIAVNAFLSDDPGGHWTPKSRPSLQELAQIINRYQDIENLLTQLIRSTRAHEAIQVDSEERKLLQKARELHREVGLSLADILPLPVPQRNLI